MIRRFNYTGRRTLPPECLRLQIHNGQPRTLDAECHLETLELPPNARVFLEVTSRGFPNAVRFDVGTVNSPLHLSRVALGSVPGERLIITLLVVDEDEVGRILGVSPDLLRDGGGDEHPLLPVNPVDLGDRIWRVNLQSSEGRPLLDVNKRFEGIKEHIRTNPQFAALVFPEVIRTVLEHILFDLEFNDLDGSDSDWRVQWLRWAVAWHPDHDIPPQVDADEKEDIRTWIEEVVNQFCTRRRILDTYTLAIYGDEH